MNNNLIIVTSSFPFGTDESFLKSEINFLAAEFQNIFIISCNTRSLVEQNVPSNCKVLRVNLEYQRELTISSLKNLFNIHFYQELKKCTKKFGMLLGLKKIKIILVSLERANRLCKFIEKNRLHHNQPVFYSYWCDDTALGLSILKIKNTNVKIVSRVHGWDLYFERATENYLPFRAFICKHLDRLYPISIMGKTYICNRWGIDGDWISVQRLGTIENGHITYSSLQKPFEIVSCSTLIPLKRVDLIVQALSTMTDIVYKWTHIGDGPELNKIKLLANSLNKNGSVQFVGQLENDKVIEFYKKIKPHLFLNVSTTEGIPVSIMEAMSLGIPVIATNVGGTSEIVSNDNGILLAPNPTPLEIALAIRHIIEKSEIEYKEMQKNAFETWKSDYNATSNYKKFVSLLKDL